MPFKGFICPVCEVRLDREAALAHLPYEHGGIVPPAVIEAVWRSEDDPRRSDDHISPSMAGGCMREYAIARTHDLYINPRKAWKMTEGSLWHEVMSKYNPPGWLSEVELPGPTQKLSPNADKYRLHNGTWEYELWPDLWFSLRLDAIRSDYKIFYDYKTKDCPVGKYVDKKVTYNPTRWPPSHEWEMQLSIYAWAVAKMLTVPPPTPMVWQLYKGIQDASLAWQPVPVTVMDYEELGREIRPGYELFINSMNRIASEGTKVISEMPLQGRSMFGGKKCDLYCGVRKECDALLTGDEDKWEL